MTTERPGTGGLMSTLAQNFDFTNGYVILRILCGLFLLPHLYAKSMNFNFMLGIYKEWRLEPPKAWLVATWAAWRNSKGKWLWNIGGCEYPFFWAIACIVVALAAR